MSGYTITRDRYEEPICLNCGHDSGYHNFTSCQHGKGAWDSGINKCACPGWKKDPDWPVPIVTECKHG